MKRQRVCTTYNYMNYHELHLYSSLYYPLINSHKKRWKVPPFSIAMSVIPRVYPRGPKMMCRHRRKLSAAWRRNMKEHGSSASEITSSDAELTLS